MRKLVFILVLVAQFSLAQTKTTNIYLIRHAEKADNSINPDLSQAGLQRAQHWNDIFSAVKFDAVYSTNYKRTEQTATPTATSQKISISHYEPKDLTVEKIKAHSGQTILIVGHSNTIPDLVNQLIGQNKYPMMEETEFGNLYLITSNGESINYQLLKNL